MKLFILILVLLSFSASAGYSKISDIEDGGSLKSWSKKSRCGEGCVKVPSGFNAIYHHVADEMIDNPEDKNYEAASSITPCSGMEDCSNALSQLACHNGTYEKIIEEGYGSVYCTKVVSYGKMPSGRKIIIEDPVKKASYFAQKQDAKNLENSKKANLLALKSKLNSEDLTLSEVNKVLKLLLRHIRNN